MPMLEILEEARRDAPSVEHVDRRAVGRARRRLPGRAGRARGRLRDAVPAHLHVRDDRRAEGRHSTCRAASSSRSRARPATRPTSTQGDVVHVRDRHGLDHGAVDRRRRRRARARRSSSPRARRTGRHDRLWQIVEQERVTSLGLSPTLARALVPHGAPHARPLVAAHVPDERRAVEPRALPLALRDGRRLARADRQLLGRHRGRRLLPLAGALRADQGVLARRARARDGDGHRRRRRALARRHRRGGRARLPQAVPGHDARLLARPRALPRDLLEPDPGRLGARRLGLGRRRRLLVPARPLRRHAQHRRQADRAGRARVGRGRAPGGARGGGDRRAARGEGRDGVDLLLPAARARAVGRARGRDRRDGRLRARQGVRSWQDRVRGRRSRRPARRRSCAAPCGRPRSASTPATSRRSRTRRPSTRSRPRLAERPRPGRIALVTGGGRGIGANVARALAEDGWSVVVAARTRDQVEAVAAEIGGRALELDVASRASVERAVADAGDGRAARRERRDHGRARRELGGRPGRLVARLRGERARRVPLRPCRRFPGCSSAAPGGSSTSRAAPPTCPCSRAATARTARARRRSTATASCSHASSSRTASRCSRSAPASCARR